MNGTTEPITIEQIAEIPTQMQMLADSIETLDAHVDRLATRLNRVIPQVPPNEEIGQDKVQCETLLGSEIQSLADRIDGICKTVNRLSKQVQL
jgi:outer membrane murein-binding lipoprotein Lpp